MSPRFERRSTDRGIYTVEITSKQTQNKIVLVNGKQLAKLMIEYDLGVSTVAAYKVKRIDSDFFNEDI